MLPKDRRIITACLLPSLKKSTSSSTDHLILRVHRLPKEEQTKPARLAIITPTKINSRAIDRHLSKRKISAYLENNLNLIKSGQYLIFQIKKDITKLKASVLDQEIRNLLSSTI